MNLQKTTKITVNICTAVYIAVSLLLTFTISDYYIFNRIQTYGFFAICQWFKKAGILLIPLAVYYNKKCCSDIAKYFLPVFVVVSCFTFGNFFEITSVTENSTPAELVFANINEFMPNAANIALFFISNVLCLIICVCLFIRDGFGVKLSSFKWLPVAVIACMPLNIFENFFDINDFPDDHFLRFHNFTVWHLLALVLLAGFTIGCYYYLRNKDRKKQELFLIAMAITVLIQYHSKDSMVMGDGYSESHTIFACVPLFICNIGIYVAALSVILKKRVLYSLAFYVHAAGALSVFLYFGREELSDFGIFCSYSILYFCITHCLLFALSVLPCALGHYNFRIKDAVIPLIYYFIVIIIASVVSAVVTSASMEFSYNGYVLSESEWVVPNYSFTQVNPLPFDPPMIKLTIWRYDMNMFYVVGLYIAYVLIFLSFNAAYYAFLRIRKKVLERKAK